MADAPGRPSRTLTVGDVMTAVVVTTSPDNPVADAAAAMVRHKVGSALIMQGRLQPVVDALIAHYQAEQLKADTQAA